MAAPALGALAKVGVTLVAEELTKFIGDMRKADDSIKKLGPSGTLVGRALSGLAGIVSGVLDSAFKTVTGTISGVFMSALRTVEYAIGTLLAGAIQGVIGFLKDMGAEVAEAAQNFQRMELRLNRFNLKEIKGEFEDMTEAQAVAVEMTKEQLKWLNKLAASTPFDAEDIANTYALARSYGFASDQAQDLVKHITNFASGMGLTEEHIKRVVINFGQMKAAGKITGTELRDLARGAFVPVNDILERTADLLGISNEKLALLRKKGLTDAEMFFVAFGQMAEDDFMGAATDMNAVLDVAIGNLKDMLRAFLSLEVVKGIFEAIGRKVSGFQDALFQRWDELESIAERIGGVLTRIVEQVVNRYLPKVKDVADMVVQGLDGIATWLENNEVAIRRWVSNLVKAFEETGDVFSSEFLEALTAGLPQGVQDFFFGLARVIRNVVKALGALAETGSPFSSEFLESLTAGLPQGAQDFFFGLAGAVENLVGAFGALIETGSPFSPEFLEALTAGLSQETQDSFYKFAGAIESVLTMLKDLSPAFVELLPLAEAVAAVIFEALGVDVDPNKEFSDWVKEDLIPAIRDLTKWVEENKDMLALLLKAFAALQIIIFIASVLSAFIGWVIMGIVQVALFVGKIQLAISILWIIAPAIAAVIVAFKSLSVMIKLVIDIVTIFVEHMKLKFALWKENVTRTVKEIWAAIASGDWAGAGKAIVDGLWRGIQNNWGQIISLVKNLANAAKSAFESVFQIKSPSAVMFDIGENIVKGLASGIQRTTDLAVKSMQSMAGAVMTPAMQTAQMSMSAVPNSVTNTTYNRTNVLNVNTSASSEPIIQDFAMLESLT
jgi:tape measure domain-containing protein